MRKCFIFVLILFSCTSISTNNTDSSDTVERVKYLISSHIISRVSYIPMSADQNYKNLFFEVYNNRYTLSNDEKNQYKEEALILLNDVIAEEGFYSDGQDARRGDAKKLILYMTLAILNANDDSFFQENSFLESAKRISYGESWYDYPVYYTTVIFLEILLNIDSKKDLSTEELQIIINKLNELYDYLFDIYESQNHDAGVMIKEDMELIEVILLDLEDNI